MGEFFYNDVYYLDKEVKKLMVAQQLAFCDRNRAERDQAQAHKAAFSPALQAINGAALEYQDRYWDRVMLQGTFKSQVLAELKTEVQIKQARSAAAKDVVQNSVTAAVRTVAAKQLVKNSVTAAVRTVAAEQLVKNSVTAAVRIVAAEKLVKNSMTAAVRIVAAEYLVQKSIDAALRRVAAHQVQYESDISEGILNVAYGEKKDTSYYDDAGPVSDDDPAFSDYQQPSYSWLFA